MRRTLQPLALAGAAGASALAAAGFSGIVSFGPPPPKKDASPPMPQPVAGGVREDGVEAAFNYQSRSVNKISTRRDGSAADGVLIGANWQPQRVLVRDGRKATPKHNLDKNGFALVTDVPPAVDYYDEANVVETYYEACEALVRDATGARLVVAFDHNVRCDTAKALGRRLRGGGVRVEGPAALVHNDYGPEAAARRLQMLTGSPDLLKNSLRARLGGKPALHGQLADDALTGRARFAYINVWRPIQTIESKPLGLLDAQTSGTAELVPFVIEHADEGSTGGIFFASHRDEHRWHFFPSMAPDEAILLKQWDSSGGVANGTTDKAAGRATFALHSAFADAGSAPTARDRESIETRLVVIY